MVFSKSKSKSDEDQTMTCIVIVVIFMVVMFVMIDYKKKKRVNEKFNTRTPCYRNGYDLFGGNIASGRVDRYQECQRECRNNPRCNYFTYVNPNQAGPAFYDTNCFLKNKIDLPRESKGRISGPKNCAQSNIFNRNLNYRNRAINRTCQQNLPSNIPGQNYVTRPTIGPP